MRRQNATETPYWIINDVRKKKSVSPNHVVVREANNNKKLTINEPVKRVAPINREAVREANEVNQRAVEPKKQNYTSFVSDYSRIHGMNYKEALQSKEIKNLYKAFNQPQNGQEFFVKHSFEQPRPLYSPPLTKVGETIFIDPRNNENTFEPTNVKELSNDQQRLQISRGLYVDLKRSYLDFINSDLAYKTFFRKSGHTQENFKPISESLTIGILDNAVKNRIQNIYSVSPFLELSVINYSFSKYKALLAQQNRLIFERAISAVAPAIITKLGSLSSSNKRIRGCDTFFLNISSNSNGSDLLADIVVRKLAENLKNYDIIFTDSNKQMSTITDFFNSPLGENIVDKLVIGSTSEKEEVLKVLRDKNNGNYILQETTNEYLENINNSLQNYAGDSRALLEKLTENMAEKSTVYYTMEPATKLERGDLFKTNPTSKKIYLFSRQEEIDSDNVNLFYINEKGAERQLQNRNASGFKKTNLRKIVIITEKMVSPNSQEIAFNKLAETIPREKLSDIFIIASGQDQKLSQLVQRKKKLVMKEDEEEVDLNKESPTDPTSTVPPTEGEGFLGGSISSLLNEFKNNFNPIFKYIGRSGIEHLYKLTF